MTRSAAAKIREARWFDAADAREWDRIAALAVQVPEISDATTGSRVTITYYQMIGMMMLPITESVEITPMRRRFAEILTGCDHD